MIEVLCTNLLHLSHLLNQLLYLLVKFTNLLYKLAMHWDAFGS